MSNFCHQISFTSSAWRRLFDSEDRFKSVRAPIDSLGGQLQAVFFAVDSYDVLAISDLPESVSASDITVAFFSSGDVAQVHTTRLLHASQSLDALRKTGVSPFHPAPHHRSLSLSAS